MVITSEREIKNDTVIVTCNLCSSPSSLCSLQWKYFFWTVLMRNSCSSSERWSSFRRPQFRAEFVRQYFPKLTRDFARNSHNPTAKVLLHVRSVRALLLVNKNVIHVTRQLQDCLPSSRRHKLIRFSWWKYTWNIYSKPHLPAYLYAPCSNWHVSAPILLLWNLYSDPDPTSSKGKISCSFWCDSLLHLSWHGLWKT